MQNHNIYIVLRNQKAGGHEIIIEPLIELRVALTDAVSEIYGSDKNDLFTDDSDKRIYLTSFPELQKEIEKVK